MHDLTLFLLLPVIGAFIIALIPAQHIQTIRSIALITSVITLLQAGLIAYAFDASGALFQFSEQTVWNARLGTSYALAIDGISLSMILLASLLSLIATMASASITTNVRAYYILLLLLESAMLGVFMARDWSLFYVFWELTLIPLFFLINRWGGENRHGAALNFVLYTMGGSVFMLLSLLVLFDTTPHHSFAMADMLASGHALSVDTQLIIFLGFLLGFGVKMPIFPLHGWLPLAHVEAPSPVSILLSGVLLKMGAYGLIRAASMLPDAVIALQPVLAALALFSLVYGGLLAWRQSDLKAMIAYSSISHMGIVLLGIAALNVAGLTGAVMQMVAHGLVAGATFLLIGLLYERTHTRDINHYCSLLRVNPRFAFFTILAFFAVVGMPGTAGFIAELHVIIGGFARWGWAMVILSLGVMISAAYAIRTIGRLFTGPINCNMEQIQDLRTTEMIAAFILTLGFILLGFYPSPALDVISAPVNEISKLFVARL